MKAAVIGIGSNSVRSLLVDAGEGAFTRLLRDREGTRLFAGLDDEGNLSRDSMDKTVSAVRRMASEARTRGAEKIEIFATSAARDAANGKEFMDSVCRETGTPLTIISGEEEAELSFLGASAAVSADRCGMIDIGGGSTEIAVSRNGKLVYLKSIPIGAVVLTEKCGQDYNAVLFNARRELKEFGEVAKILQGEPYCIGGTCTSLAAVAQKLAVYDPERVNGYKFTAEEISGLAARISSLSVEERKGLTGMQKERADIIHAGACIFQAVAEIIGAKTFTVSESDNLEGYLNYKRRENEQKN